MTPQGFKAIQGQGMSPEDYSPEDMAEIEASAEAGLLQPRATSRAVQHAGAMPCSRRRLALAGLLATGLVLVLGATYFQSGAPKAPRTTLALADSFAENKNSTGAEESAEEDDLPCSALGEDCSKSKCCQSGGKTGSQCFEKNEFWAACAEDCAPGVHEGEEDGEWTCKALGPRSSPDPAYCAGTSGNCASAGCCKTGGKAGMQCYRKDDFWASCLEVGTCQKGVHAGEPGGGNWSCQELGPVSAPDPCSAPGEDCRRTKCCSATRGGAGMTCFEKDETWASCSEDCAEDDWSCKALGDRTKFSAGCGWGGKDCSDTHFCCNTGFVCAVKDELFTGCVQTERKTTWDVENVPIPGNWDGTVLGGARGEFQVQPADEGAEVAGTSLYCFMAILPNSSEVELNEVAKKNNGGIYACDGNDLFHSWASGSMGWDTGESTLANTDVFVNVWEQVQKAGKYMKYDWTCKVDADAVLVPDRLKSHLAGLRPPPGQAIYIKNNGMDPGMGNNGFLGAVEVFSKKAVMVYFDNADGCHEYFGNDAGEDGYFKGCMDAIGVGFMADMELFFPDSSAGACSQGQRAAFHPLKKPEQWQHCWDIVTGKTPW